MPRNTVATAFFAGVILLALGLYIAADRGAAAASAPYVSTLGFAIAAGSVYLAGIYFLPRPSIRPLNVEWRRIIYWTMFGSMIAASIAFVAYTDADWIEAQRRVFEVAKPAAPVASVNPAPDPAPVPQPEPTPQPSVWTAFFMVIISIFRRAK